MQRSKRYFYLFCNLSFGNIISPKNIIDVAIILHYLYIVLWESNYFGVMRNYSFAGGKLVNHCCNVFSLANIRRRTRLLFISDTCLHFHVLIYYLITLVVYVLCLIISLLIVSGFTLLFFMVTQNMKTFLCANQMHHCSSDEKYAFT